MDSPELEFLLYLLKRFIDINDIDADEVSLRYLLDTLDEQLTPIGGG